MKVKNDLRSAFPECYFEKIQQRALRGTPDLIACIRGWFVGLEVKTDTGKADPLQRYILRKIQLAGGVAFIVTPSSWPEVLAHLKALPQAPLRASLEL